MANLKKKKRAHLTDDGRLRWTCPLTNVRKCVRVGLRAEDPVMYQAHVDQLVKALRNLEEPPEKTKEWLQTVDPKLRKRLRDAGLFGEKSAPYTTLEVLIEKFIAAQGPMVSTATNAHYRQARDKAFEFFGKDKDITKINVGDAKAFSSNLRQPKKVGKDLVPGLAENTARKRCATMQVFFNYAIDCEFLSKNPFANKDINKNVGAAAPERRYHLTQADALKVLDACQDPELAAMFALCRWGGLRVGETLLLTWEMVHFGTAPDEEDGTLNVPCPKTEHAGKAWRTLPLFPEVNRALRALQSRGEDGKKRLLPNHAGKTTQWAAKELTEAIKSAGLKPWPRIWQNLRATRATELADRFPGHVCAEWLGHTEQIAEANYRRATSDHFKAAARIASA